MLFPFVRLTILYKGTASVPFRRMHGNDKRTPANSYGLPKLSFRGAKPRGNLLRHCTKTYGVSGDCQKVNCPEGAREATLGCVGLRLPRNDNGNGDLVLLPVVRLRTPREGCPYGSASAFFGIMRIDLALHGRAVGLRPPQRKISEFLSPGHLASGILDMVYFI